MTTSPPASSEASDSHGEPAAPRLRVLGVHGLRNYVAAPEAKVRRWLDYQWSDALRDGLREVAFHSPENIDVHVAYYSPHLHDFESDGGSSSDADSSSSSDADSGSGIDSSSDADTGSSSGSISAATPTPADTIEQPYANDLSQDSLEAKASALLAEVREQLSHREDTELWRSVFGRFQGSSRTSSASEWLAQTAERINRHRGLFTTPQEAIMLSASAELAVFVDSAEARASCRQEVIELLETHRPAVVVAHSLGSAVAYEALHATDIQVDLFITAGSPLGARSTIQEVLSPALIDGRGSRPSNVARWVNIADPSDVVPLVQDLATCYDGVDADLHPTIGTPGSHAVEKYLRCPTMGGVLAQHLVQARCAAHRS